MSSAAAAGVASFLTRTAVFFVLKLTTSVDDVLWLSPFLALADGDLRYKLHCGLLYAAVCLLVTVEALIIDLAASYGFEELVKALAPGDAGGEEGGDDDDDAYWNASRLLCIFASIGIAAYACKELMEWRQERDEEGEEDDGNNGKGESDGDVEDRLDINISRGHGNDEEEPTVRTEPMSDSRRSSNSSDGEYKAFLQTDSPFADEEAGRRTTSCNTAENDSSNISVQLPAHFKVKQGAKYEPLSKVEIHNDDRGTSEIRNSSNNNGTDSISKASHTGDGSRRIKKKHTLSSLFVVAFFGTLDDLALFSAVLMGKSIQYPSLLCGSMLAAAIIVLASWCVSLFKPFADVMQRIPLWALLFAIAVYIFIDGIL